MGETNGGITLFLKILVTEFLAQHFQWTWINGGEGFGAGMFPSRTCAECSIYFFLDGLADTAPHVPTLGGVHKSIGLPVIPQILVASGLPGCRQLVAQLLA